MASNYADLRAEVERLRDEWSEQLNALEAAHGGKLSEGGRVCFQHVSQMSELLSTHHKDPA